MTDLEGRVKRRSAIELPASAGRPGEMAMLWDLEAADTANPIVATAVVRRDASDTTGPDLDAFAAAFATALTQHDEEYL